ncbi:MAG: LssY C-terminal domain-containing protein [Candidatus Portnoybacteria bacterium]|nr:LssY C-terminal domain-containing protein [Candidatus Portnoybacteria bacterium]
MDFLNSIFPTFQHLGMLGYWIVLLISLAEALPFIGLIIPGTILVGLFGFFSARGYLDIGDLIWFSAIGAILGDSISYYLGTRGTKLFRQENKILKLSHLESGEQFFKKHGNKSIFLGRFISPLRPIIPFVAGLFRMDKKVFLFWNIISGILWAISFLLLGYFFGGALNAIEIWSSRVGLFVLAVVISVIIIRILIKYAPPFFAFLKSISLSIKEALTVNPDIKNFIAKHPLLSNFVHNRLNKNKFSGMPLTLLSIAFVYILFLFFGIIEDILASDVIVLADTRVANLLFAFRDTELIKIFTWITLLGKWQIVISSALVLSIILWLWRKRLYLLPFWVTIAGSELFNSLGKLAFHRARPDVAFYAEDTFSFPSGHATISIAFYGFLTYILFRQLKKWKYKINALFFGIIIILAIGLSRLYLGVHFLSDVWGGYLLGALWLLVGITISEWLHHRKQSPSFILSRKAKIFTLFLILAEIIFYVNFALRYNPPIVHQEISDVIIVTDTLTVFSDKNIPRFTETLIGDKQEPLSFVLIAENDRKTIEAMQKAGWYFADSANFASVAELAKSAILNKNYPTAPMTPSFWNAKVHDFGFEKPTETQSVRERHHVRFWRTQFETQDGKYVYVGTASQDIGIKWLVTHTIKSDIDTERELLFSDLESAGVIFNFAKEKFIEPTLGKNFSGDQFFTDGEIYIVNLK